MGRKFNTKNLPKNDDEKVKVTAALPAGMVRQLIKLSGLNKRSLASMIEIILDEYMAGEKK